MLLNIDDINNNDYIKNAVYTRTIEYPIYSNSIMEESRTILPAFQFREVEYNRFEYLFLDPQRLLAIETQFPVGGINTRIIEKNKFIHVNY